MSSNVPFSVADMVFHLSEHFLENSEKLTEASGCFFLCSSWQVCTNNAYDGILPLGFLGSSLPMFNYSSSARRRVAQCPSGSHLPWYCLYGAQCTAMAVRVGARHSLLTLSNLSTIVHFVSVWQGLSKIDNLGTSLAVQLRFQTSIAGSMGSVPSQGTKIPHALRYRWKNKI